MKLKIKDHELTYLASIGWTVTNFKLSEIKYEKDGEICTASGEEAESVLLKLLENSPMPLPSNAFNFEDLTQYGLSPCSELIAYFGAIKAYEFDIRWFNGNSCEKWMDLRSSIWYSIHGRIKQIVESQGLVFVPLISHYYDLKFPLGKGDNCNLSLFIDSLLYYIQDLRNLQAIAKQ